jgi:hypothetical protein
MSRYLKKNFNYISKRKEPHQRIMGHGARFCPLYVVFYTNMYIINDKVGPMVLTVVRHETKSKNKN